MVLMSDIVLFTQCFMINTLSYCTLQLYEVSFKYSFNCFQLTAKKINKAELLFMCMTGRLNVLYKCMKLHQNIFYGYVIERTQFCDEIALQMIKGNNSKNKLIVLAHET